MFFSVFARALVVLHVVVDRRACDQVAGDAAAAARCSVLSLQVPEMLDCLSQVVHVLCDPGFRLDVGFGPVPGRSALNVALLGGCGGGLLSVRVRLFFVGGRISLCGSEAGGNWIRHGVVREQRRGPVADGTCAVSDGWGCSAGTRALGGGSQYASMRRRPVAA